MPVNVTLEMVQQLLEQNASLLKQNEMLTATIAELNQTIQELKEQLNKNSKNSSKPPSSDGFKKPAPKSLRKPSGKKVGGQNGHQGTHLSVITAPDEIVKHMPSACEGCPHYQMCKGTACIAIFSGGANQLPALRLSASSARIWGICFSKRKLMYSITAISPQ